MRFITPLLLLLAVAIGTLALPLGGGPSQDSAPLEIPKITSFDNDFNITDVETGHTDSTRFSCGQYKFDDGWVQNFYSQVWAGRPRDEFICHSLNYELTHPTKKNQPGKMVAAKVDRGCTCFFYTVACDPSRGYAETWKGWGGWNTWAYTDKPFRGWWCYEAY